jgi:hypothetical protein
VSAPIPAWHGVVTPDGKLELDARGLFTAYVKRLKNSQVTLTLKKRSRAKSQNQLGYLFGVIYPVIADEIGYREYEVEEVHDAVMRTLRGLKPEPNPLGLRVSLAEMTHEEVSTYISDVRHWAVMEFGIVTPDADSVAAKRMEVTTGRTVHYRLSASDVQQINRRRTSGSSIAERMKQEPPAWPAGAQAHIGNPASEGDTVPMLVVRVWSSEQGGNHSVNGQAFLDGNDALWVTSAKEGTEPGQWSWPPRV